MSGFVPFSVENRKLKANFHSGKLYVDWNGQENFFFVLKSLVPTQSSQDKENLSCPFQSTDNFPEWKLAFNHGQLSLKKTYGIIPNNFQITFFAVFFTNILKQRF
jgi:hypothetical protein